MRQIAVPVLLALLAPQAFGQQFDRRARDEPEIAIEAGGRVGTCDVLRFTPDGQFLLAAGDDKVVHVWPHTATGLDTTPLKAKTLRWRAWRDQLGGIKAVGVSPDGKQVAVGGYGLRISSVAIIDRESGGTFAITWPRTGEGIANFDAVTAIGYHPDGKRLGFGTADGTLWLWEPKKLPAAELADGRTWNAPVRVGRFEASKDGSAYNVPKSIRFPDQNTLVAVAQRGQVMAFDLAGPLSDDLSRPIPTGQLLFNVNDGVEPKYAVFQAEWTGDGRWLVAATAGPLVLMRSADGKETIRLLLPAEHFCRSLAVYPKTGKLAVGVGYALPDVPGQPRFYREANDEVWVYDKPLMSDAAPRLKIAHSGRAEALAFHSMEDRLAIAGGDADEISLIDLAKADKPISVTRGTGRHLTGVNLSENGDILGVRLGRDLVAAHPNEWGDGAWVRFQLSRFKVLPNGPDKWVNAVSKANGWSIVPDSKSSYIWYAERKKPDGTAERLRLGLNPDLDLAPTCYTFVPTPAGQPARVLVGHYYGCSLFELAPERAIKNEQTGFVELPRSKVFIGHGAEVNSVVADAKGTWFVTAGSDQTVAAWSLTDWSAQPALGASFEVANGQLAVKQVDVASPAYEAGLTAGDLIDLVAVDGRRVYDRRAGRPPLGAAKDMADALAHPQPGIELVFGWTTPGQAGHRVTPTRIKQRPLWKWFPAFDDEDHITDSVIWMWYGSYYFTASVHGDRMVGWHLNDPAVDGTPMFHPLERFKHLFLKPDAISRLIATRSVEEALKVAQNGNALKRSFREVEPAPVTLAIRQGTVGEGGIPLTIAVTPQGNNPDLLPSRIELWVNDYRYGSWPGAGLQAQKLEAKVPAEAFRAGDNQLTVLALNPVRGRAEDSRLVANPIALGKPDLHGLAIGINDYSSHRVAVNGVRGFGDLGKAKADAVGVRTELLTYTGEKKCFPKGEVALFLDAAADRKSILEAIEGLKKKRIRPDDLLVVFFAGHGDLLTPNGKAELDPGQGRGLIADIGRFVFCCPTYAPSRAATTALSGEELFDLLAGINCRKLVLLDACHAGGAVESNVIRRVIPNGQGPLVIAACDQSEQSFEDDKIGHGIFTYAVLEAFGPRFARANVNSDGRLSPQELFNYVHNRVPVLIRDLKPGNTQTPICFPQAAAMPKVPIVTK